MNEMMNRENSGRTSKAKKVLWYFDIPEELLFRLLFISGILFLSVVIAWLAF